jgi:hypothetical protein
MRKKQAFCRPGINNFIEGRESMFSGKNLKIAAVAVMSGIFAFSGLAQDEGKKLLRYNFTEGDKYLCVSETEQTTKQTIQGQDMEMKTSMVVEMTMDVQKVAEDGKATIALNYDRMRQVMKGMGNDMVIDTDEPAATTEPQTPQEQQARMMQDLISAVSQVALVIEVKPTGESVVVGGMDEFKEVINDELSELDPQVADAMSQFMDEIMTSMTDSSIDSMFSTYPADAVSVGDTWNNKMNFGTGQLPIDIDLTYTGKSIEDGIMTVGIKGKMDMGKVDDGSNVIEMDGMKMDMQISGLVDGYNKIDLKSGLPVETLSSHSFDGSVKMEMQMPSQNGGEAQVQTMSIPMEIKGSTKTTITKKTD